MAHQAQPENGYRRPIVGGDHVFSGSHDAILNVDTDMKVKRHEGDRAC